MVHEPRPENTLCISVEGGKPEFGALEGGGGIYGSVFD